MDFSWESVPESGGCDTVGSEGLSHRFGEGGPESGDVCEMIKS